MTPQLSHSSPSYEPFPIPRIATLQLLREITLTSAPLGMSKRVSGKDLSHDAISTELISRKTVAAFVVSPQYKHVVQLLVRQRSGTNEEWL